MNTVVRVIGNNKYCNKDLYSTVKCSNMSRVRNDKNIAVGSFCSNAVAA